MGCVHGKCCRCCSCSSCCRTHTIEDSKARLRDRNADNEEDDRSVDRRGGYRQPEIRKELPVPAVVVPSHGIRLEYASLTQQGHYPDSPNRENQDCLRVETHVVGNPNAHFFAVFDGHGHFGSQCSNFAKRRLFDLLTTDPDLLVDPAKAYASAFHAANVELHENEEIDDSMSGTTAVAILLVGDMLHVANVGDSRAVAGVWDGSRNRVVARDLSRDQTPFRKDEYERVKGYGARVLSVDQVEGLKDPSIQSWGEEEDDDEGDPPRVWVQDGMYPGTAFTRSIGDSTAEEIGVTAEPEVLTVQMTPDYLFFVLASDGVFEFLPSQVVVDMNFHEGRMDAHVEICFLEWIKVAQYNDPRDACSAITEESYRIWLEHETRTDDITVIVVHIKDACNSGTASTWDGSTLKNNSPRQLVGGMQTVRVHSSLEAIPQEESFHSSLEAIPPEESSLQSPGHSITEKTSARIATSISA